MSLADSLATVRSPPPAVREGLVWIRLFHPAATSGGSFGE